MTETRLVAVKEDLRNLAVRDSEELRREGPHARARAAATDPCRGRSDARARDGSLPDEFVRFTT